MKLLVAIVQDRDRENISQALVDAGFRITRIASTGGFLRRGNTTMMIGLDDERVDEAIKVFQVHCSQPSEPNHKRVSLFILKIDCFEQI